MALTNHPNTCTVLRCWKIQLKLWYHGFGISDIWSKNSPLVLLQFMAVTYLYFPSTMEWPEIHLLYSQWALGGQERQMLSGHRRSASTYQQNWALHPPHAMGLNHSNSHQTWREVFRLHGAAGALSPSQAVQSASLLSLVSQNALSREVRGSFAGGVILIPSLADQFGMTFLSLPWKQCLESQKRKYVWRSAAARCGEGRALISRSPSSHWGKRCQL